MNKLISKFFENRGIDDPHQYMSDINNAYHTDLKNVNELCSVLHDIKENGKHIVIYPDFDMDGIMSGVIGFAGLSELGFRVSLFIPQPNLGYEITPTAIDMLLDTYPDTDVILTCDVGSSCVEGVDYAVSKGVSVLVTDHHKQDKKTADLLQADIVVNPMRYDETYSHPCICGAYVLYQCLFKYAETYCSAFDIEQIKRLRVFAGIGTISDVMPLLYENRALVNDAVDMCQLIYTGGKSFLSYMTGSTAYCKAFYGLYTVFRVLEQNNKILSVSSIDEVLFAYYISPIFNSVKRLGGDMSIPFGVFFGYNPDNDMATLYAMNIQRKQLVKDGLSDMLSVPQPYAPYIYLSDCGSGILGLLATNMIKDNGVPTLVLRLDGDTYYGSGRSCASYPCLSRLSSQGFNVKGHEHSFGVTVPRERIQALYDFLSSDFKPISVADTVSKPAYDFTICVDMCDVGDTDIDIFLFANYINELKQYKPFGEGFVAPTSMLKFRKSDCSFNIIGSSKQHTKISLPFGFDVLCFNQVDFLDNLSDDDIVCIEGHLSENYYAGIYGVNFIGTYVGVNV